MRGYHRIRPSLRGRRLSLGRSPAADHGAGARQPELRSERRQSGPALSEQRRRSASNFFCERFSSSVRRFSPLCFCFSLICISPLSFNLALGLHFGSVQAVKNVFRFLISARCGDFHSFVSAFHLSFDTTFLNGRVELSQRLQLLACHSYSILS